MAFENVYAAWKCNPLAKRCAAVISMELYREVAELANKKNPRGFSPSTGDRAPTLSCVFWVMT